MSEEYQTKAIRTKDTFKQQFVFKEDTPITLKIQIYYEEACMRCFSIFDADVRLTDNVMTLNLLYEGNDSKITYLLAGVIHKKDYKIKQALIDGMPITLKIGEDIRFTRFYREGKCFVCSMLLQKVIYSYEGMVKPTSYRLSSLNYALLSPFLTDFVFDGNMVVGTKREDYYGSCYNKRFCLYRDERNVFVQTEEDIETILSIFSFYFCAPIEFDMKGSSSWKCNVVEVVSAQYKTNASQINEMLRYLYVDNESLEQFFFFMSKTNSHSESEILPEIIRKYISNYIRAEFVDSVSKLLLYNSMLEKMAGVQKGEDTYKIIQTYLEEKHICIEKINAGVNIAGIKNGDGKKVENFVQLRNFFVHDLGSRKAEKFLRDSKMLFNLKLTLTILLLNLLDIENIKFDRMYHEVSVFDRTIKETNYINA